MRVAVFSDIHSNIDALDAVLEDAASWGAQSFFVAGDIVGYGASPEKCIKRLIEINAQCVAGNHDLGVLEKTPIDKFNHAAQTAIIWTREKLSKQSLQFLKSLPLTIQTDKIALAHANFTQPELWEYVSSLTRAGAEFENYQSPLGIVGHSHVPFIVKKANGEWPMQIFKTNTKFLESERVFVNVGSVGQPRDGDPRSCYLRIDMDLNEISLIRLAYDIKAAQEKIKKARLPEVLAFRLSRGR